MAVPKAFTSLRVSRKDVFRALNEGVCSPCIFLDCCEFLGEPPVID